MHRTLCLIVSATLFCGVSAAQTSTTAATDPRAVAYSSSHDNSSPDAVPPVQFVVKTAVPEGISQRCAKGQATKQECKFHWRTGLRHTMTFLAVQDAGLFAEQDNRWATLHGHWFNQYVAVVTAKRFGHWNDGDPFFMNYVGHPMQGGTVGFIYIQNDPRGQTLEISKSRAYWTSRLRAMAWDAAYEINWELGALGEAGIGFEGKDYYISKANHGWTNGAGWTDFVATPTGGFIWMISEDGLDKVLVRPLLARTHNPVAKMGIAALNPNRSVANLMRFKWPWYRDGSPAR